jgi:uncharacterized protein (DUF2235 family)
VGFIETLDGSAGMPKNIVVCCDGTGNEIEANLSNVLKLFRVVRKSRNQVVYYNPGVGTISTSDPWSRLKADCLGVLGLATGYGLDANVLGAYQFVVENYEKDDSIYLFGFSRGAYTIRVLGGFVRLIGLLGRSQINLCPYALTAYKRAAEKNDFEIAWRFERVASTRRVPIKFVGVWDTVSSVIVPRPDRLYIPSLEELPYTKTNSYVEIFRQAIAIDERRRMFRINHWAEPQEYKPNPFDAAGCTAQDIKQVWFAGVHADIGGGYPETESGLAKYPLQWMIDEAVAHGVEISAATYNHLVLGHARTGGSQTYVAPDFKAKLHNSMSIGWLLLEGIPKRANGRDWPKRRSLLGWYLPLCEPRRIDEGARVHFSVFDRLAANVNYRPVNLPPRDKIVVERAAKHPASATQFDESNT